MANTTQFSVDRQGDVPIVRIDGDLDHYISSELRHIVADLIGDGQKNIILDMSAVDFMDSGGMSAIVFAIKSLSSAEGCLLLANCVPRIARKFEIAGLTQLSDVLSMHSSLEEALQHTKQR